MNRSTPLDAVSRLIRPSSDLPRPPFASRHLLLEMIDAGLVLDEEAAALDAASKAALDACTSAAELLKRLVEHGLLTQYQADRLEAGKIHGLMLGPYRVLNRHGAGAMGIVFKAEHVVMRRLVAIKVLPMYADMDPRIQQRFLTEIRVVARLQHPNIVAAMDAGSVVARGEATLQYFVMEFVQGEDLEEYVLSSGPMSAVKACDVIHQSASALAEAFKHDLVHRDIKPSNIRITPEGQAKLLDFGLAREFSHRMTEPGTVLGTLDYMAPEQTADAGAVDIRADIYALGGTLYWCLTGKTPFQQKGNMLEQVLYRRTAMPPSVRAVRPELPAGLDELIARMMALDPADRPSTPEQVGKALLPFLNPEMGDSGIVLTRRAGGPPADERRQRILIVDDQPELRRLCRIVLETEEGPQCEEAPDGPTALEMVRASHFDLVLLDVNMPGMDGAEVRNKLRETPPSPYLKIIMMSGQASGDEMAVMLGRGADDYIGKPFSMVQLQSKVKAALTLKAAQDRNDRLNNRLLAVNRELERSLSSRDVDLLQARNGLVHTMAKLVEYREGDRGMHLMRMERYTRRLAEEAAAVPVFSDDIDPTFVDLIACCSVLRDIGKVGLPDHILLKPGKLDPDERILMQTHTIIGAERLLEVVERHGQPLQFLRTAADIARHHHERFDGDGYPDRLAGTAIPLAARITAVADVYDALRSRRSYKPALSHSSAFQVMTQVSAGQFDPNLIEAFRRCAPDFEQIFHEMPN